MTGRILELYERRGLSVAQRTLSRWLLSLALPLLVVCAYQLVGLAEADRITNTQGLWLFTVALIGTTGGLMWISQRLSAPMLDREVRRLEEALAGEHRANMALAAELERRQRFLTYVHHELRTPVTVIAGSTELLAHADLDPDTISRLSGANLVHTRRLRELVEDLADGASAAIEFGIEHSLPGTD